MIGLIIVCACLFLIMLFAIDRITTSKRLKENQASWDEYSKGMTQSEKHDCFVEFLERRKHEKGWRYYYIPRIEKGVNNETDY